MTSRDSAGSGGVSRTVLRNVKVFDGASVGDGSDIVIDGCEIGSTPEGAHVIDGDGLTLLPGLIDAHVHLHEYQDLERFASFGVTTALDMASWPPSFVDSLRGQPGLTDIRSALCSCTVPGTIHSKMDDYPPEGILEGAGDAAAFVARRVAEGADYIKMIADSPGPDQETLDAVVNAAHELGRMTVTHASNSIAYEMAAKSGTDVITHVPLDRVVDPAVIDLMLEHGQISVPTLTMMEGIVARFIAMGIMKAPVDGVTEGRGYAHAHDSVSALHAAGVPILAGTDANCAPSAPAAVAHGESIHRELELLVAAGLSTLDALRAATDLPARHFGLADRGRIAPGLRADLLLVSGDPLKDIRSTQSISRVWCGGKEYLGRKGTVD
jgi:imidazolonepropionase-like amidohydrolase